MNRILSNGYKLLYCNGLGLMYGFIDLDHITHYLMFSVKINTNQLNGNFNQSSLSGERGIEDSDGGGWEISSHSVSLSFIIEVLSPNPPKILAFQEKLDFQIANHLSTIS